MQAYRTPTFSDVPCKSENIKKHDYLFFKYSFQKVKCKHIDRLHFLHEFWGIIQELNMEALEVCPPYDLFME